MVILPLLRVTIFAQLPTADLKIESISIRDFDGQDTEIKFPVGGGFVNNNLFKENKNYRLQATVNNVSKRTYNNKLVLVIYDIFDSKNKSIVLGEYDLQLKSGKNKDITCEFDFNKIPSLNKPKAYYIEIRCFSYEEQIPWIKLQGKSQLSVIIGEISYNIMLEKRKKIDQKYQELYEKEQEDKKKNGSSN